MTDRPIPYHHNQAVDSGNQSKSWGIFIQSNLCRPKDIWWIIQQPTAQFNLTRADLHQDFSQNGHNNLTQT